MGWIDYVGTDYLHHRLFLLLGDKWKAVLTIFLYSIILGLSSIALRNARMIDNILLVGQAFLKLLCSLLSNMLAEDDSHPQGYQYGSVI